MDSKLTAIVKKLDDERSGKVIFVSHCLLNENTRYLGGAFRQGCVDEVLDEVRAHCLGVIQMRCPEQRAWGGVLKRRLWLGLGLKSRSRTLYRMKALPLAIFLYHTKRVYRKLAREVVSEIRDYIDSGLEVVGIIGIDGSPSCSVNMSVDLKKSFDCLASLSLDELDRNTMNAVMVRASLVEGSGLFVDALKDRLAKRNLDVDFFAHDLASEMTGGATEFKLPV